MNFESDANKLAGMIREAQNIVFFGGAGVSTESGIPDFRGEQTQRLARENFGLAPETILSADFFYSRPETFYRYLHEVLYQPDAAPGPAHTALARLEEAGKLRAVITQNIDGLHTEAGSARVLELHGSLASYRCLTCGETYSGDFALEQMNEGASVPRCDCDGLLKPDVVLYQEALPEVAFSEAAQEISEADLVIVAGTSLQVQPAASLLSLFQGENLVLINRSSTPWDSSADLLIKGSVGPVLSRATDLALS